MTRFQLVFRRDGHTDQTEQRLDDADGEPHIDGRSIVDGETFVIRGVDWLVRRGGNWAGTPRSLCTLVVEPVDP